MLPITLRWRTGCACAVVAAAALLAACGGGAEDASQRHPAMELFDFVPDYGVGVPCWTDDRAYMEAIGLGHLSTLDELDELIDSLDFDEYRESPSWDHGLFGFFGYSPFLLHDFTEEIGVNIVATQEHLAPSYQEWDASGSIWVRRLPMDDVRLKEALLELGYVRRQIAGDKYFQIDLDVTTHAPLEMWAMWLSGDLLLHAGSAPDLEEALDAYRGRVPSLGQREDLAESLEAMGTVHVACAVHRDQPRWQLSQMLEEESESSPSSNGLEWQKAVEALQSQYADWGRLYAPDLFVIGYVARGKTGTMKIALRYGDSDAATAASPELERRMREYEPYLLEGRVCEDVHSYSAGRVLVGECTGGLADKWSYLLRAGGLFFLTDDFSPDESEPCPRSLEPCA